MFAFAEQLLMNGNANRSPRCSKDVHDLGFGKTRKFKLKLAM